MKKEYDILKVVAILMVLVSHSTYYIISTKYGGIDYQQYLEQNMSLVLYKIFDKVREILYYFHMPMFMALSGAFYYLQVKRDKWINFMLILKQKIKRLVIPFIIFTLLYVFPIKYFSNYFEYTTFSRAVLGQLFLIGNNHLWYLFTLFIIFIISFFTLKREIKFATIIIFYVLHILSYKVDPLLFKAPLQFLFYFSMGFAFESKREKYNQFISKKRNYVLILSTVFVLITLLNFNLKYTYTLVSKILVELLAILGSLLTYSISYLISRKERSGSSYFFKLILMNGLGIYIFSDPLNYLILYISYSLNSQFMFSPFGIIFMVVLRFFITLFVSLIVTVIFKKCFKKYTWLVN